MRIYLLQILIFFTAGSLYAQDSTSTINKVLSFPDKLFGALDKKTTGLDLKLQRATLKYLSKIEKQEEKLKRKLWKKDSVLAKELFTTSKINLSELKNKTSNISEGFTYSGRLDSLTTSLKFVNELSLKNDPRIENSLSKLKDLQKSINATEEIRKQLIRRQQYLKEQFEKLGLVKELKQLRKQVYYYQNQLKEFKNILNDPAKQEALLLAAVTRIPAFKDFFASNSQLGSIFGIRGVNASNSSLIGLQTRASVQQTISASVPGNPKQFVQTQLVNASKAVSASKEVNALLPKNIRKTLGFKPNNQKGKSFKERLEKGFDFQFGQLNKFLPTTADIAGSIAYKLNDEGRVGIGSSYKLGIGTGIADIQLSHQGFTFRSFIDWKIKGSIFIAGGYEKLFIPNPQFQNITFNQWQESGLIGISKKYKVSKKLRGNLQISFDFLSYKAIPKRQPIIFRTGYNF